VVVRGDYLLGIAQKLGVSLQSLLDANAMTTSSLLAVGQRLVVPAGGPTTASAVTERTALDKSGRHVLDPMIAPLDGTASAIDAAEAVAVTARRVGEPPASVRVTVLLGAYVDTSTSPPASARLAYAVRYESACTTVSPSGSVATTSQVCGPTTVVDAVTGGVVIALDG
jgi:LysM repeat protein